MNRKFLKAALAFALSGMMFSCSNAGRPGDSVAMTATVTALGEKLEVEVTKSEYTSGTFWVITTDALFYDSDGSRITKDDIKIGDSVEILYSGQVMLSYPPQIVAARITLL